MTAKTSDGRSRSVALIGLGRAAAFHMAALDGLDGFHLTDVCDSDPAKAALAPPGVTFHTDVESLLAVADADLFVIASPTPGHADLAVPLLAAGRAVMIEKPAAVDAAGWRAVTEAAGDGFLQVAFHAGFGAEVRWLAERQAEIADEFGALTGFASTFADPYRRPDRLMPAAASLGGAWLDSGINALSVIGRFVDPAGLVVEQASMTPAPGSPGMTVSAEAVLRFPGRLGAGRGTIAVDWTEDRSDKTSVLFHEGAQVILDHKAQTVHIVEKAGPGRVEECRPVLPRLVDHYAEVYRDLATTLAKGRGNIELAATFHRLLFEAVAISVSPDGAAGA